jgi:ABC-type multidrug transport system fused ATPase/permease subunit
MNFYDKTPAGRIINRMSNDVLAIDEALPLMSKFLFSSLASLLGSIVSIIIQLPFSILSYYLI